MANAFGAVCYCRKLANIKLFEMILIAIVTLPVAASAQNVIAGPFHKPALIPDGSGKYTQALLVYEDKTLQVFTEDVTSDYGLLQQLHYGHTFTMMMYFYSKKDETTAPYLVSANTDKKTVVVRPGGFLGKPQNLTFDTAPHFLVAAVLDTAYIMAHEISLNPSYYNLK